MSVGSENGSLGVAVFGVGTVGGGVIRLLQEQRELIAARAGRAIEILGVSARDRQRERSADISSYSWYDDPVALAESPGVGCLVEATGQTEDPALSAIRAALRKGRHVVTANKALLALHGSELAVEADESGSVLAFEAAVGGGIPVIKNLAEGLAANEIQRVYGVLNGTCNFILTEMERTGADYFSVLEEALELGYAEADPSMDVGGVDAAHKLALLAALAFGTKVDFEGVSVEGIERVQAIDIEQARDLGYRIRLLGVARMSESGLEQRVQPCLVPAESILGTLEGVTNAVALEGDSVGRTVHLGPGAGGGPTASAIVADLVDIARGFRRPTFGIPASSLVEAERQPKENRSAPYYVRLCLQDRPGALAEVAGKLGTAGVSIDRLRQYAHEGTEAPVLIVTHETLRADLDRALDGIRQLKVCTEAPVSIRIECV